MRLGLYSYWKLHCLEKGTGSYYWMREERRDALIVEEEGDWLVLSHKWEAREGDWK